MPVFVSIPLTVAPLLVYNLLAFSLLGDTGGDPWQAPILTMELVSGARFTLVVGDLMILSGLVLLFIELLKATRTGVSALTDHILSTLVFIAYLVEFLTVRAAATSVFFTLMAISLVDVIAGFSITITGARRDFGVSPHDSSR
ncbi:MAG: hypothetical protein CMN87_10535 [Stappia sp.]|jgi:hypothetical protein|uniref:hypothetical protein n=1 Tax=Stappia sp. TaxID=1870903 RepID=UPI000C380645|nr:hypothetical protein [Stappia sp.]MAA99748.1 hypothetical protein [Stappia sp.]MBM20437.1 hypothetical protein [Stappia sp.]|tara:strand:- start:115 stop:543 length:429 start_codon:yes stop_codon:yes gene_type:complete